MMVWLHPPHLINVATPPCESQNTKNVILQQEITKENCIKSITASSKWTRVIMCLKFTYLGCYTVTHVWNESWRKWPARMLDANVVWLWPGHYRCYDWPVAWPSEIMCACWWWTLWTHALTWMFIYMILQNILWNCQCNMTHITAILQLTLKAEVVFRRIFSVSNFTR